MEKGILVVLAFIAIGTHGLDNSDRSISILKECYENNYDQIWNLLPHTMENFIAIIRKIEESPNLNMDLHTLSSSILHRFRQYGITWNPDTKPQYGVIPYSVHGESFFRHSQVLKVIPGDIVNFPNSSLTLLERCTLHSMISSSFNEYAIEHESRVCRVNNPYRRLKRNINRDLEEGVRSVKEDAVTLTPEQVKILMQKTAVTVDPNSFYPAFPPNHPDSVARYKSENDVAKSECPIRRGVIKTRWGTISGGEIIAAIAAGLTPQRIPIRSLIAQQDARRNVSDIPVKLELDAKFLATLSGKLAEVALKQGPRLTSDRLKFTLGIDGNWNSTSQPLYYFMSKNENLEMTADEIRGGLDGLIMANLVPQYVHRFRDLKLSQVLDMYYSNRGLFRLENRACNRKARQPEVGPRQALESQAYSAGVLLLASGLAEVTIDNRVVEKYVVQATDDLLKFIPTLPMENACDGSKVVGDISRSAVDLTILLEPQWPFETVKPILAQLLDDLEVSKFGSNVTIMSAYNGLFILNSTNNILDFHRLNSTEYDKFQKGFDLSVSLERLRSWLNYKLEEERTLGWAGGRSQVIVIMPYQGTMSQVNKEICLQTLNFMKEEVPDTKVLFLTRNSKAPWSDLVENPTDDIEIVNIGETTENHPSVSRMQSKIKQVSRRLINTQCGFDYKQQGSSKQLTDYVTPTGTNIYRIHPNYFMSDDTSKPPTIKIQSINNKPLKVCHSRKPLPVNASSFTDGTCDSITSNVHQIKMNCEGETYLHKCKPYYISVTSTTTNTNSNENLNFDCSDSRVCRYPDDVRYTISFENLVCKSGASGLIVAPLLLLTVLARFL